MELLIVCGLAFFALIAVLTLSLYFATNDLRRVKRSVLEYLDQQGPATQEALRRGLPTEIVQVLNDSSDPDLLHTALDELLKEEKLIQTDRDKYAIPFSSETRAERGYGLDI